MMQVQSTSAVSHKRSSALVLASAVAAVALPAVAPAQTRTFVGPGTAYETPANWSGNDVPDTAAETAVIDAGGAFNVTLTSINPTIGGLTIGSDDSLTEGNGRTFAINGPINNAGNFLVASAGNFTDLYLNGATLSGGGTLTLQNFARLRGSGAFTNNSIIQGDTSSSIGANELSITNSATGVIRANVAGKELVVDPVNGTGTFVNAGTLRALGTGTLVLTGNGGGTFNNTGGLIEAQTASVVRLENSASVSGGTLTTSGTGEIRTANASIANVTNNALVRVQNGTSLTLSGTIGGTGSFVLASAGNFTNLFVDATNNATLGGGQTVTLTNAAVVRGFGILTNNGVLQGETSTGGGSLGANETTILNNNLIDANVAGQSLFLDPGAGGLTNTATLRASNGGTLTVSGNGGGSFTNTGGTIQAANNSVVQISGASVSGGNVNTAGTGVVQLSNSATLSGVTFGGTVNVVNGQSTFLTGTITNNAAFTIASGGSFTDLYVNGATLNGTGTLTLQTAARLRGTGAFVNNSTINGETSTGGGSLGTNELTITNNGLINANNAAGQSLQVDPAGAVAGVTTFTNNSTLRASGGGRLILTGSGGGEFENAAGTIEALAGSVVRLENNVVIKNGAINAVGTGAVEVANSTLSSVTFSGNVNQVNGSSVTFTGTNNGAYTINSAGSFTDLYAGGATIGSGGTVTLKAAARIRGTGTLTNNGILNGETSTGGGSLGANEVSIANAGTIDANVSGQALLVDPAAAGQVTNTAIMQASGGGTLQLSGNGGGNFVNAGGTVRALNGSKVQLVNSASLSSGTLTSSGTGVVELLNGTALTDLTLGGTVNHVNGQSVSFAGTITNNAAYTIDSGGGFTDLYVNGSTLNGTGTLTLKAAARVRASAAGLFTNNSTINGETSSGGGSLGNNEAALVNNGLIDANVNGLALSVDPSPAGNLTNTTTMRASGGGTLQLNGNGGGSFINTGGTIEALAGSKVQLVNSASLSSGALTSSGTGVVELYSSATLSNVTLGGTVNHVNGNTVTFAGTITNNGAYTVNSGGGFTDLYVNGSTLNGTGTLTLKSAARVRANAAGMFTNNSTINGETSSGSFGSNEITVVNNGLVDANVGGQPLAIDPTAGTGTFTNGVTGIVRASNGGTLQLNGNGGGSFTNNGTFEALNSSTFTHANSAVLTNNTAGTLTNGTYRVVATNPAGSATMILPGGNISTIAANTTVELSGTGSAFSQIGSLTNNAGTFKVLDNRSFTTPSAYTNTGVTQLGGGTFTGTGGSTNTAPGEIFGFGGLAGNVSNTGLIRANGGTLQIVNVITGGAGSELRADSGATFSISGATGDSSTAKLTNNGTLALGARNVQVTSDYTNANFGTGNTFNPRAQVTGTGQILASPAVQQTISGVTNGATATPTLALGNIRVGSSLSVPISVNNVGASGPSIRGAIQTTNAAGFGGNITDGRLSGTAMAADFGPIAPGASSTPFTVIFNGTSSGALTGQQLAVVNNFDNVAEQTVSITGAAYNPAVASVTPPSVFVGNFHVGDAVPGSTITFANTAPAGAFSEDLGVSGVTATGTAALGAGSPTSFNVLAGASNTSVKAAVSTATAGAKSGNITASLTSTGQVNGVAIPGLAPLSLTGASVPVTGNVYRLATAVAPTPINLGDKHVGDSGVTAITVNNTATNDGFSESLQATAGAITGNITAASGSATVAPGGSSTALSATISTASAGAKTGTVGVGLTSVAVAGTGLSNTPLTGQTVTVNANVYNLAAPQINNSPVQFGVVHVGDVVTPIGISITNTAPASFSEKLNATPGTPTGGATASGSITGQLPQTTNTSGISVGINTATAGVINGTVPIAFVSDGAGINSLGTTNLAPGSVTVTAQVNNYAKPTLSKTSGAGLFGGSGTSYTLDFGTVAQGSPNPTAVLALLNDVLGPADTLAGTWTVTASNFITSGFNPFSGIVAGGSLGSLTVALDTTNTGLYGGTITLAPRSQNTSGYNGALSSVTLNLSGEVLVPEPTIASILLAGGALLGRRTRRAR